jgi:ABC-type arginine transport system permease subunit
VRAAWKEIWKGALQAIGAFAVSAVVSLLALWMPQVRHWAAGQHPNPAALYKIALTIFLALSTISLLVLFAHSRVELFRLRRRIAEDRLTLADLAGGRKPLMKAVEERDRRL